MAPAPRSKAQKSYPQNSFQKLLRSKTPLVLANDNTDMLVYLIYMDYMAKLLKDNGGLNEATIESRHRMLIKRYRG